MLQGHETTQKRPQVHLKPHCSHPRPQVYLKPHCSRVWKTCVLSRTVHTHALRCILSRTARWIGKTTHWDSFWIISESNRENAQKSYLDSRFWIPDSRFQSQESRLQIPDSSVWRGWTIRSLTFQGAPRNLSGTFQKPSIDL